MSGFILTLNSDELEQLLVNFQVETNYKNYSRIDYNTWRTLKAAESVDILIDDYTYDVLISDNIANTFIFISHVKDESLGEFIADWYEWEPCAKRLRKHSIEEAEIKKEKDNMKMFSGFEFGSCEKDNIKLSPYGVAVKNANGVYVSYKADTGEIIDVDIANFDGGKYLFKMPVAFKNIKVGDVIIHNRKPHFVTEIKGGNIATVDVCEAEEKRVIPVSNMFGFNFVTKVVSLFDTFMTAPSADQPFGNMLPFFLLNEGGGSENLLLAMMLSQGGATTNFNPMMLYLLAGDKKNDNLLPLFLMSQGNFAPTASK